MSAYIPSNEEKKDIFKFLSPELCEDAGIILINFQDGHLDLGAMNLDYIKVKKVINTIESEFNLTVSLKQITSLEWETWFENTHSTSVETIQKNALKVESKNNISNINQNKNNEKVKKIEEDFYYLDNNQTDFIENFDEILYR